MRDNHLQSDHPDYVRDTSSNALLNKNVKALEEYRAKKKSISRIYDVENDLNNVKQDLKDIKSLLLKILEKE